MPQLRRAGGSSALARVCLVFAQAARAVGPLLGSMTSAAPLGCRPGTCGDSCNATAVNGPYCGPHCCRWLARFKATGTLSALGCNRATCGDFCNPTAVNGPHCGPHCCKSWLEHRSTAYIRRRLPAGRSEEVEPLFLSHPALSWRCDDPGLVSLTFDDAPDPHGAAITHTLALLGVNATFFVEGARAARDLAAVARLHAAGHQVAAHSFTHTSFIKKDPLVGQRNFFEAEIGATELAILAALPPAARSGWQRYFRAPYLELDPASADELMERGYQGIDATVDTKDFDGNVSDADRLLSMLTRDGIPYGSAKFNSPIVLMHANHLRAVALLPLFVRTLRRHGYRFVRIDECVHSRASASRLATLREWAGDLFDNAQARLSSSVNHTNEVCLAGADRKSRNAKKHNRRLRAQTLLQRSARRCPVDVPLFIISLPNSLRRREMKRQLHSMQCFHYEFVDALTPEEIPEWSEASQGLLKTWNNSLDLGQSSQVEFAITLSHLRAARQALRRLKQDNVSEPVLIVEDDVDFSPVLAWPYDTISARSRSPFPTHALTMRSPSLSTPRVCRKVA